MAHGCLTDGEIGVTGINESADEIMANVIALARSKL